MHAIHSVYLNTVLQIECAVLAFHMYTQCMLLQWLLTCILKHFRLLFSADYGCVLVWGLKIKGTAKASCDVQATRGKYAFMADDWINTLSNGLGHAVSDCTEFYQLVPQMCYISIFMHCIWQQAPQLAAKASSRVAFVMFCIVVCCKSA